MLDTIITGQHPFSDTYVDTWNSSIHTGRPFRSKPDLIGFRRPTDNCFLDLLVTPNYLPLSPTDEPTSSYDAYTTYPFHQDLTARPWPPWPHRLSCSRISRHILWYMHTSWLYTRAPMTSLLLYIHVSLRRTVQSYLPHMYIINNIYYI